MTVYNTFFSLVYFTGTAGVDNTYLKFSCPANEDEPINLNYICSRLRTNSSQIILPAFNHSDQ